jgi:hypothetical protein
MFFFAISQLLQCHLLSAGGRLGDNFFRNNTLPFQDVGVKGGEIGVQQDQLGARTSSGCLPDLFKTFGAIAKSSSICYLCVICFKANVLNCYFINTCYSCCYI